MKRFIFLSLAMLFVVAMAMPAMATDARQRSLAGTGNYIEDDYNIFAWPATLPSYSNIVWVSLEALPYYYEGFGYFDFDPSDIITSIGATYGLGSENKYGTLGMFMYEYVPGVNPLASMDEELWSGSNLFSEWLDHKFTLLYGYAMEGVSFGITFSNAQGSYVEEDEDEKYESSMAYNQVGAGIRFDVGEKAYADFAADMTLVSYKNEYTDETTPANSYSTENDANKMFGVKARMFYEWNETITWVPYFHFRTMNYSLKSDVEEFTNYGDKATMFQLGLGANIKVNEDNLLIFAIEPYTYVKREPSEPPEDTKWEATYTLMPTFYLALESDVRDWLTFRVGGNEMLYKTEYTSEVEGGDKNVDTWTGSDFALFMGLGFHVSDFDIDAVIRNVAPFSVGYWLTGYSTMPYYESDQQYPVYLINATYHF